MCAYGPLVIASNDRSLLYNIKSVWYETYSSDGYMKLVHLGALKYLPIWIFIFSSFSPREFGFATSTPKPRPGSYNSRPEEYTGLNARFGGRWFP